MRLFSLPEYQPVKTKMLARRDKNISYTLKIVRRDGLKTKIIRKLLCPESRPSIISGPGQWQPFFTQPRVNTPQNKKKKIS